MVAIIMGSDSDLPIVQKTIDTLKSFGVKFTVNIISAHRTPDRLKDFVERSEQSGTKVFIGVAGKAAHLAGVIAAYTTRPVVALPIKTSDLGGLDSLLSMVQMPSGIPVATVAINGGENAGILAVQMLSICDDNLKAQLMARREEMKQEIEKKDNDLQDNLNS